MKREEHDKRNTIRGNLRSYISILRVLPDIYEENHPLYQPEDILKHNDMYNFNQEVMKCLHCQTVINFHTKINLEECPFCNRDLKGHVKILKAVQAPDAYSIE